MIIGLTGGMGCGKSTAGACFEERGWARIDADRQVKEDVLRQAAVKQVICQRLGSDVFDRDGEVDRVQLGRRVFADDDVRRWLEGELHPRVYAGWREWIRSHPGADLVIEVPLLFEQGLENWFDFIVCVTTSSATQLVRLEKRGFSRSEAEARISKQLPLTHKAKAADFVLSNDGSREFLQSQVDRLLTQVR